MTKQQKNFHILRDFLVEHGADEKQWDAIDQIEKIFNFPKIPKQKTTTVGEKEFFQGLKRAHQKLNHD